MIIVTVRPASNNTENLTSLFFVLIEKGNEKEKNQSKLGLAL